MNVRCPRCDRPRSDGPECPYCGVVYAKFRQASPERLAATPLPDSGRRSSLAVAALVVAAAITVLVVVVRARRAGREPGSFEDAARAAAVADDARAAERRERADPGSSAHGPPAIASAPEPSVDSGAAPQGERGTHPGAPAPEPDSCSIYAPDAIPDAQRLPTASAAWYDGAVGFQRATEEHASSGAPLLALFYTDWCPHCRRFAAEVIPSAEMRSLNERMVKVKVNAEGSDEDRRLAKQFSVTSYPTLLLFAKPGAAPDRVRHWDSPVVFVDACERALPNPARDHLQSGISLSRAGQAERAAAELRAAASDPKLAAEALDHLGALALGASCFDRSIVIYTRILDAEPSYGSGRARYLRGLAHHRRGDKARALADAEEACRLGFKDGCTVVERARSAR